MVSMGWRRAEVLIPIPFPVPSRFERARRTLCVDPPLTASLGFSGLGNLIGIFSDLGERGRLLRLAVDLFR